MRHLILLLCCSFLLAAAAAQDSPRRTITLDTGWGIKAFTDNKRDAPLESVTIPHTWNADYLEGTTSYNREMMIYKRNLEVSADMSDKRLFLYFEGVNSAADVFVNYQRAGSHLGGYTAFCFEITDLVKPGENDIEVWVSNAYRTDILPISGDFNIYGGIHRPCHLIVTERNCISPIFYASPGMFIRQNRITEKEADITVKTMLSLNSGKEGLTLRTSVKDARGQVVASSEFPANGYYVEQPFLIENPVLWNAKKNPYLYHVTVELCDDGRVIDAVTQRTGFRFMRVDPEKGFFLNGERYGIHGFCRHEDVEGKGSALIYEDYLTDMELINESGATAMRLAHYPHAEPMYDLSDENGIILWTEIPMCGPGGYAYTGYIGSENYENNARQQLQELVYQKFNHPSICFWGIFNEILVADGGRFIDYGNPVRFVKELNELYKQLDPSRFTAFATCVDQTYYLGSSDLVAWNKYFGYGTAKLGRAGEFFDDVKANSANQPVGVSEYGAGGSITQHMWPLGSEKRPGTYHPEEAQSVCHEGYWESFITREYLWCTFIWVFSDFQSSIRYEGDKDGMNDKGIITYDRKTRKDIFYFYKANWNPEPTLYISSRRFTHRNRPDAEVKVYSNLSEATLFINDKKVGNAKRDHLNRIIWNDIFLIPGENKIRVEGKSGKDVLTDTCTWIFNE